MYLLAIPTYQACEVSMSDVLFGVIKHNIINPYKDGYNTSEYTDFLYAIQKIAIEQRLTILFDAIQPNRTCDEDYYKLIPGELKESESTLSLMIVRAPNDITSDALFGDWEYESCREGYVPGQAKVFKELENVVNQVFALNEVKRLWLRYQCMFACEVNKLETFTDLEAQIYKQCSNGSSFQVSDFEINLEKEKKQ